MSEWALAARPNTPLQTIVRHCRYYHQDPTRPDPTARIPSPTDLVAHMDARRQHFGGGLDIAPGVELVEPWTRTVDHGGGGNLQDDDGRGYTRQLAN